ncbi:MAG: hypothetical protein HC853_17460 [Anaerolineae bacterium]|nr:hypothetical protein [Anaerolineae bacterium]
MEEITEMLKSKKHLSAAIAGAGLVVMGCLVLILLLLVGDVNRVTYLWFEIPRIQSAAKEIPGIKIAQVEDQGPSDEFHVLVTIEISGKGQLILANPRYESFTSDESVMVVGVGSCFVRGDSELDVVPLKRAIAEYERLHDLALKRYGGKFAWCK